MIIVNDKGIEMEYSLKFSFRTSNKQAEYEACLTGIRMAKELGATTLVNRSDSQLMVSQIRGDYSAKELILHKYLAKIKESLEGIFGFEI